MANRTEERVKRLQQAYNEVSARLEADPANPKADKLRDRLAEYREEIEILNSDLIRENRQKRLQAQSEGKDVKIEVPTAKFSLSTEEPDVKE